jgi:hypothetical protein
MTWKWLERSSMTWKWLERSSMTWKWLERSNMTWEWLQSRRSQYLKVDNRYEIFFFFNIFF